MWEVDLVGFDLVGVDFVEVDFVGMNQLFPRLDPALNLDLKSGTLLSESQECLPVEIQKSISDDPR